MLRNLISVIVYLVFYFLLWLTSPVLYSIIILPPPHLTSKDICLWADWLSYFYGERTDSSQSERGRKSKTQRFTIHFQRNRERAQSDNSAPNMRRGSECCLHPSMPLLPMLEVNCLLINVLIYSLYNVVPNHNC